MALYPETKALQEEQNAKFPNLSNTPQEGIADNLIKSGAFKNFQYNPNNTLEIDPLVVPKRPASWRRNLTPGYDPSLDSENLLADRQNGFARLVSTLPRAAIKAASEVAQIPGYAGSSLAWAMTGADPENIGMIFDNFYNKAIQKAEQEVKDLFPAFTSDAVKAGGLWKNIWSSAFWANEGADAIGYWGSMIVPGATLRVLKLGARVSRMIKPGSQILKLFKAGDLAKELGPQMFGKVLAGKIDDIASTIVNTGFEATVEAGEVFKNVLAETGDNQRAGEAAVDVMAKNWGILLLPNYLDQKWLFGSSKLIRSTAKDMAMGRFERALGPNGKLLDKVVQRTTFDKMGEVGRNLMKGIAKEGFWEEGLQYTVQKQEERATDDEGFFNDMVDIAQTYWDSIGDVDMQKSIFLGGLLGSVMSGVKSYKDIKADDVFVGNFHRLLKESDLSRYTTYKDVLKKNADGSVFINPETQSTEPDPAKTKEQLKDIYKDAKKNGLLVAFAKSGNEEAFSELKDLHDFKYFMTNFLTFEGGLEAAKLHINDIAQNDFDLMESEGVPRGTLNEMKQDLLNKVDRYADIYRRIDDTHDINMMDVKYDKKDVGVFKEFDEDVKNVKFSKERQLSYATSRVNSLRNKLGAFPLSNGNTAAIVSGESKYTQRIVEDLQKSFDEQKGDFTKTDIDGITKVIKDLGTHLEVIDDARQILADVYDPKFLKKEFKGYLQEDKDNKSRDSKTAVDNVKTVESQGLAPILQNLYDKATRFENINNQLYRRQGEVTIQYTNERGEKDNLVVEILSKDEANNLSFNILGNKEAIGSISDDNNFFWNGKLYKIDDIQVTKSPPITIYKEGEVTSITSTPEDRLNRNEILNPLDPTDIVLSEGERLVGQFDPIKQHLFKLDNALSNWLVSQGDQAYVASNDDLGRWHMFVNKHANLIVPGGKHRFYYKTYTNIQVAALNENDPIRQNLKFFDGTDYKTVDKLVGQDLDDIKIVVFDSKTNNPLQVSKNGEIDTTEQVKLVYTSLPLPSEKTSVRDMRFALNKVENDYLIKTFGLKPGQKATKSQVTEATKYAEGEVLKSIPTYKKYRSDLKKGTTTLYFNSINPGVKKALGAGPLDLVDALHIKNVNILKTRIFGEAVKPGTAAYQWTEKVDIAGTQFQAKNGYWYVTDVDNRLEPIIPKTLGDTQSVETMLSLLKYYAKDPKNNAELEQFLRNTLYMGINNSKGEPSEFKLFFTYRKDANDKPMKGELDSIVYGTNEMSVEEFLQDKDIDKVSAFLKTKYWNFNNGLKTAITFTEYTGIDKKGKLTSKPWDAAKGGYIGFLFSNTNNTSKGSVIMRPQKEGLAGLTETEANYFNQSVNFSQSEAIVIPPPPPNKKKTNIPTTTSATGTSAASLFKIPGGKPIKATETSQPTTSDLGAPISAASMFTIPTAVKGTTDGLDSLSDSIEIKPTITQTSPKTQEEFVDELAKDINSAGNELPSDIAYKIAQEEGGMDTLPPIKNIQQTTKTDVERRRQEALDSIFPSTDGTYWIGNYTIIDENGILIKGQINNSLTKEDLINRLNAKYDIEQTPVEVQLESRPFTKEEINANIGKLEAEIKDWEEMSQYGKTPNESLENFGDVIQKSNPVSRLRKEGLTDEEIDNHPDFLEYKRKNDLIEKTGRLLGVENIEDFNKPWSEIIKAVEEEIDNVPSKRKRISRPDLYSRKANLYDNYELENLNLVKAWLKEKFPLIPVQIIDGLINEDSWGMLTKNAEVLLSSLAEVGTGYHEGFHVFSQLVLAKQTRIELYNELRKRTNREFSDKEAEEFLAEEFRTYMMAPNAYTFAKDEKTKKTFFERLLDLLLGFINRIRGKQIDYNVETVFNTIRKGTFGITQRTLTQDFKRERVGKLSPKDTYIAMQDFNATFMNDMLFHKDFMDNSLFMLDNKLDDLYLGTKYRYEIRAKKYGVGSVPNIIYTNFKDIVSEHKRYLKTFQIDLGKYEYNEEVNPDEDDKSDRDSGSYTDNQQVNLIDKIKDPIRLLVASLPNIVEDDRLSSTYKGYKSRSTVEFNSTMAFLNRSLVGLGNDFSAYADKLFELSQRKPELEVLLRRLGAGQKSLSKAMLRLQGQFVTAFSHTQTSPRILKMAHDGTKYFLNPIEETNNKKIKLRWINRARKLADKDDSSIIRSTSKDRRKYILDSRKILQGIVTANTFPENGLERMNVYRNILDSIGIKLSNDPTKVTKYDVIHNYIKYLGQEIADKKGKEIVLQDLYNADVIKNQKETTDLLSYAREFLNNDDELSYINQDGNREYSINLNSHMSDVVNSIKRITINPRTGQVIVPPELDKVKPWDGMSGNLYSLKSKWWAHVLAGGEFSQVLLKGISTPNVGHSAEISKAFFGDLKSLEVNAILSGVHPNIKAADRKTEYSIYTGKPNYNIDIESYKEDMMNYIFDELITSFALLVDPENWGGNLSFYSKNAKSLRVFNFIYDLTLNSGLTGMPLSLEEFKNLHYKPTEGIDSLESASELTNLYLSVYHGYFLGHPEPTLDEDFNPIPGKDIWVEGSFDRFIQRDMKLLEESLAEHKIIQEYFSNIDTTKSNGVYFYGLDPGIISDKDKFNITRQFDGSIKRADLDRLLLFISNEQFVSANEQFKLFLGDPAMFENPVGLLQRVTGATSPREAVPDWENQRSNMEKLYKRVDGKNRRTSTISTVIVDDVVVSNSDLAKIHPEYDEIVTTDGASNMTLDEQRDLLIKTGNWDFVGHEKTYQYEMQSFIMRLLNLKRDNPNHPIMRRLFMDMIDKSMFTDENGIFYEHTKGAYTTYPMFEGKEITLEETRPITILKPQGFGSIDNISGLNATQYLKTAVAPIFPLSIDLDNPMLESLLSMMENQQGLLAFRKSMKLNVTSKQAVLDDKGQAPIKYVSQDINYRDIGIQLDIAEEAKKEVTASTQRQGIEFYNIFDRGKLIKDIESNKLDRLNKEYTNLINEIIELKRKYLIDRFGLVLNEDSGKYGLTDKTSIDKFKEELLSSIDTRLVPDTVLDGIEIALESNEKVLDMTTSKFQIEEHLMSIVRNEVIARKTAGDMLIQEPNVWYSKKLKFYEKTKAMEVMIALPRRLIPIAESVGGIDELNKLIAARSSKLGEDFYKMLTIPMNRIPGQNPSSLDVANVVAFHPHYHGSKVTLPDGITVKAGSDFDVDKMTSYLNDFTVEDGKVHYWTDLSTIQGKQNRLNEISAEVLLHEERFEELIKPLTTTKLKKLSDKSKRRTYDNKSAIEKEVIDVAENIKNDKFEWGKSISLWYNMQKAYEFWKSKMGTSAGAVTNIFNAKSQIHPIRMKAYVPLFFKGQRLAQNEEYTNGFTEDASGELISDNLSAFISFFIDTVKDPGAMELADNKSFGILSVLNMFSKDTEKPIGLETINAFMSQKIITDYTKVVAMNQSRFLMYNEWAPGKTYKSYTGKVKLNYNEQYAKAVDNLRRNLKADDRNLPTVYTNTVAYLYEQFLSEVDKSNDLDITDPKYNEKKLYYDTRINKALSNINTKILKYDYKDFSLEDLQKDDIKNSFKDQVQILDNFLMYKIMAGEMIGLNMYLRPEARSGMYRHMSAIRSSVTQAKYNIKKRGLFNIDDVDSAIDNSFMKEFQSVKEDITDIFGFLSVIHKDQDTEDFFINNVYSVFANPKRYPKGRDLDRAYTKIESMFATFLLADSYGFTDYKDLQSKFSELFMGDNSIPKQLAQLQSRVEGNLMIENLEPNISDLNKKAGTLRDIDNITLFNNKLDPYYVNAIEGDFVDFSKTNKDFTDGLMMHSVFQSGPQGGVGSYLHVVPNKIFIKETEDAIDRYMSLSKEAKEAKLKSFLRQMYKNSTEEPLIVPRVNRIKKSRPVRYPDDKNFYGTHDFIAQSYYTQDPDPLRERGETPTTDIVLLERVSGTRQFRATSKLGDGRRFSEFYPMLEDTQLEGVSIRPGNNYSRTELATELDEYSLENDTTENIGYNDPETDNDEDIPEEEATEGVITKDFSDIFFEKGYSDFIGEDQTNSYFKSLGKEFSIQKALKLVEDRSKDKSLAELAKVIRFALGTRQIPSVIDRSLETVDEEAIKHYADKGYPRESGTYTLSPSTINRPINDRIVIYEKLNEPGMEVTIVHEAIHALSELAYQTNKEFSDKIKKLSRYTYRYLTDKKNQPEAVVEWAKGKKELFADPTEFLTHGLTSSHFQRTLARIQAENPEVVKGKLKQKSVLSEFIDSLFSLILDYFSKLYSIVDPGYVERKKNLTSVLHELIVLSEEDLLDPKNPAYLASDIVVEDLETLGWNINDTIIKGNLDQLKKEDYGYVIEFNEEQFDELYPGHEYFTIEEKISYKNAVDSGIIQIACGI